MNLFTLDIDWAPEPVIEDTLALFEQFGVKCTLFATHLSPAIIGCNRDLFEVALHPNFNPLLAGTRGEADRIIEELCEMYPEAVGIRSHSTMQSAPLLELFGAKGMLYEANLFLPYWKEIHPYRLWNGLLRIPYNWEDDVHFLYGKSFSDVGLDSGSTMNVLDFHPVHVFLNTDTKDHYDRARPHTGDTDELLQMRNTSGPGARTLLIELLRQQGSSITLRTLAEQQP